MQPANLPVWWTPDLDLGSPSVKVEELSTKITQFLVRAAHIHVALTGTPLVITSGNDGQHVHGSAHYKNAAVDLRSNDIGVGYQMVFGLVLSSLGNQSGV